MTKDDGSFALDIDGMHCGGCVRRLTAELKKIPGVVLDEVAIGKARGRYDPSAAPYERVIDAVVGAGYRVREPELG